MRAPLLCVGLVIGVLGGVVGAMHLEEEEGDGYGPKFVHILGDLNEKRKEQGRTEIKLKGWELGLEGDEFLVGDLSSLRKKGRIRHQIQGISNSHKVWGSVGFKNLTLNGIQVPVEGGRTKGKLIIGDNTFQFEYRIMTIMGRCVFEWRKLQVQSLERSVFIARTGTKYENLDLEELRLLINHHMRNQAFLDYVTDKTDFCEFENSVYPECCGEKYTVNDLIDKAFDTWNNQARSIESKRTVTFVDPIIQVGLVTLSDLSSLKRVGNIKKMYRDAQVPLITGRVAIGNLTLRGATILYQGRELKGDVEVRGYNSIYFESAYTEQPDGTCKFQMIQMQLKEAEDVIMYPEDGRPPLDVTKETVFDFKVPLNLYLGKSYNAKTSTAAFLDACNPNSPFRPLITHLNSLPPSYRSSWQSNIVL